ncbi:sugar phosphate nucleotidyltransferase [Lysinibacillus sp. NPDC097231]|uniref:sugar phosphate nucleotidyltransferase n=1 Tax=Lysinibacillus sp. NPDC097231 TaxID=3364142 RepID=UPI00380450CA
MKYKDIEGAGNLSGKMKGVILAGGEGSRMAPFTEIINKFLLPVYDKILIEYSIYSLKNAGVVDIAIVLGKKSVGETINFLKDGTKYGVNITYLYQSEALGMPNALYKAKEFVGKSNVVVLCADNIVSDNLKHILEEYRGGALITCKKILDKGDLSKFSVFHFNEKGVPINLIEKPKVPPSHTAFCGIQIYDCKVWGFIQKLKLSDRKEYEITDIINEYISIGEFHHIALEKPWFDCGTPDSLVKAQIHFYEESKRKEWYR